MAVPHGCGLLLQFKKPPAVMPADRLRLTPTDPPGQWKLAGEQISIHDASAGGRTTVSGATIALPGQQSAGIEMLGRGPGPFVGCRRVSGGAHDQDGCGPLRHGWARGSRCPSCPLGLTGKINRGGQAPECSGLGATGQRVFPTRLSAGTRPPQPPAGRRSVDVTPQVGLLAGLCTRRSRVFLSHVLRDALPEFSEQLYD